MMCATNRQHIISLPKKMRFHSLIGPHYITFILGVMHLVNSPVARIWSVQYRIRATTDKGKKMKKLILSILAILLLTSCAHRARNVYTETPYPVRSTPAAQSPVFIESANVLRVVERIEQVNQPQQECHNEYVEVQSQNQERRIGGALIGGVAGGLLGNTVGKGNGKTAATAVGAVVGALVGDRIQNDGNGGQPSEQVVQRCHIVDHVVSRVAGYEVTYEYEGHQYTTVMPRNPGDRINLQIRLSPHL
jgi:uncharacterized protein YcfJ